MSTDAPPPPSDSAPSLARRGLPRVVWEACAVGVLLVVVYIALRATDLVTVGAFNDDGVYAVLGRSIAGGQGYRLAYLPGTPPPVAVKFPPGLPALLALPWLLGGGLPAVRLLVGIVQPAVCGLAAGILWWIARHRLGAAPLVAAVFAIGPLLLDAAIEYYNIPLAEPYFLAGWATALLLVDRLAASTLPSGPSRPGVAIALGLVLAATALFRGAGVVLIPALLLALMLRRIRPRDTVLCAAAALLPLVVWGIVHSRLVAQGPRSDLPDELPYWRYLPLAQPRLAVALAARALAGNSVEYSFHLVSELAGRILPGAVVLVSVAAVMVVGAGRQARQRPELVLSVVAALAVVWVWPFAQDRILLPVLPFAGLLAVAGVQSALARVAARWRTAVYLVLGASAVAVGVRQQTLRRIATQAALTGTPVALRDDSPRRILLRNSRYALGVAAWVRAHTTLDDRIMVELPAAVFLYTGRRTVPSDPPQVALGSGPFAVPGRYLAHRILADSVTVVVVAAPILSIAADIAAVRQACPTLLSWSGEGSPGSFPGFYRVTPERACLEKRWPG